MKKIIKILCLFSILFIVLGCNKTKIENFPKYVSELESYKLTGILYSMFPSSTKESLITVYKDHDNIKVEVDTENGLDKQIILKNNEGTFVLVPSLNKSYKINSGWPMNSSYPYLLESISRDYVNDTNKEITKDDSGNTNILMNVQMFENMIPSKQKVIFDKDMKLKEVLIYDAKSNLVSRFVVQNIEENKKFESNIFDKTKILETTSSIYSDTKVERVYTYPTYYPKNTSLDEEKTIKIDNIKSVIMKYLGDYNYTIVQTEVLKNDVDVSVDVDGDLYIMGNVISVINENNINFVSNGINYMIASNDLDTLELIKMGDSLIDEISK